jgi:uncharacterized membrane protein YdjX (TVP38/TMEM64 family)
MIDKDKIKKLITAGIGIVLLLVTMILCYNTYDFTIKMVILATLVVEIILFLVGIFMEKDKLYKIAILIVYFGFLLLAASTLIIKSGVFAEISTAEDLINIINSFGVAGKLIFVLIQFLQVTFIPIPSTIVTAAAAALYSPGEALLLSCIGLWIGSLFAFFLGRVFGVKLVKWVIGDEMLLKYNSFIKGKDKAMLIYMFIFPIFPDDMLCMLAGLTTMSYPGFIVIQLISRPLNVAGTIFAIDYLKAIPFAGWGIALWTAIAVFFVGMFVLMWKYSEKVEKGMLKLISKIVGRPIIKDVYAVYNIYNKDNDKQKGIGYTETTCTTTAKEHKEKENNIVKAKEIQVFEKNYTTINNILQKKDKPIDF